MAENLTEFERLFKDGKYNSTFEPGSLVKGSIVHLEKDGAYVDIKGKSEAFVPLKELAGNIRRTKAEDHVALGQEFEFYILKEETDENPVILSLKRVNLVQGWIKLEESKQANETIKGKVASLVKGGIIVELFGIRGFVPTSQLRLKGNEQIIPSETSLPVKILELDQRKNKLILSHKLAVQEEKADLREKTMQNLELGQIVEGEVVRVTDFGAFIDLGGIDGLLPISEFSWQRINHPQDVLSVGQKVELKVLKIDRDTNRISLSLKRMQNDPWNELEGKIQENQTIKGTVSKIANFGAFIEVHPGVEGLLPKAEITAENENPRVEDYLSVGQEIEALVKRFAPEEHRLSLSLKDLNSASKNGQKEKTLEEKPEQTANN
ncbi:MAG: S1 RNA-binding domain-containing protein [Candidatus Melainabacteria bacterium]|nr:S1 RNA-binding domain-containing protein [Candidatus Melainabacteria bacterium]MBI3308791.1 S1 RNA-binding domain-containing protein [Candidatus Melainabacteria bacterium]